MSIELLNMDCMDYLRDCEDNAFDLAIVDPPYGIGRDGQAASPPNPLNTRHGGKKYFPRKGWDTNRPSAEYFRELRRVATDQIVWGGNYFCDLLSPAQGWIFWDKMQRGFNADGEIAATTFNRALRVVEIQRGVLALEGTIHPTQKPVKLYDWLLTNYAKPDQRILDTHLGSGSSAIAAHYFGVDFVGIEIDKNYYDAACKRFEMETSQLDLLA